MYSHVFTYNHKNRTYFKYVFEPFIINTSVQLIKKKQLYTVEWLNKQTCVCDVRL